MADFDPINFLEQNLQRVAPSGGFGLPNIGALRQLLGRESASGLRAANAQDQQSLQRQGMGRSVAGAFSGGTRQGQFSQGLMEALTRLQAQHGQLGASQRQGLMQALGPAMGIKYQQSQHPSFLSSLLGNVLGTGAQLFGPGLASKALGNPMLDMMKKMFSQSGSSGTGYNPQQTAMMFDQLQQNFQLPRPQASPFKLGGFG